MMSKQIKKGIIYSAAILIATVGIAFAHGGGYGYGGPMMGYGPGNGGYGYGMMGPGMMGYGNYGGHMMGYGPWANRDFNNNLSDEQIAKLDSARTAFFNDTRDLRDQIQDKQYSLGRELDKETPDVAKVTQLQKEISKLKGDYDQKNIEFQLELRKILPDNDYRAGFGPGNSGGYCW